MSSSVTYCCLVPVEAVGLIVGRGGATVRQIQQDSGASIDISREEDTPPALGDRVVALRGEADAKAKACEQILLRVFQAQGVEDHDAGIFVLIVPSSSTGFIIGPKGTTITGIMESSGADISISRTCIEGTELQPISVSGDLKQVLAATLQVTSQLQTLADRGRLEEELWPPQCVRRDLRSGSNTPSVRSRSKTPSVVSSSAVAQEHVQSAARSRSTTPSAAYRPVANGPSSGLETLSSGAAVASGSRSSTPVQRGRVMNADHAGQEASTCIIVDAPVAAWIVGKQGRMIQELRTKSGASIEVDKHGGATRLVELGGTPKVRAIAIELVLECINGFPAGAPRDLRMRVPPAISVTDISEALRTLSRKFAIDLDLLHNGADRFVRLAGQREAITQACQELAACMENVGRGRGRGNSMRVLDNRSSQVSVRSSSPAPAYLPARSVSPISGRQQVVDIDFSARYAAAQSHALGMSGQTPSEAKLLKMLLSGPKPNQAELRLVLPVSFVQQVLVAKGGRPGVAERSGSSVELGPEHNDDPATQIVTLKGQMLGNAMAVLYIQELLAEHS